MTQPVRARLLKATLAVVTFLIVMGVVGAYRTGTQLAAPVPREIPPPPASLGAEELRIDSASGSRLAAWLAVPQEPRAGVVLLHGVRADRRAMLGQADLLLDAGYAVLLPDLQAHGESPGEAITFGHLETLDAVASFRFLHQRLPGLRIGGIGQSLGGAAMAMAGAELDADAVVLEMVFPTISEAIDNRIALRLGGLSELLTPLLLVQLKPRLGASPSELRPIDHVAELGCPVLVAAGTADRYTTEAESRRLFAAASEPKELWMVEGAGHHDLQRFDPDGYQERVLGFLNRHLTHRPG